MSRTYRKRPQSFESYYYYMISTGEHEEYLRRQRYKFKTKTVKYYAYNLPKFFRNMVNRKRRVHDKAELYKELNHTDYVGAYSRWNCKDNDAWGYW